MSVKIIEQAKYLYMDKHCRRNQRWIKNLKKANYRIVRVTDTKVIMKWKG